MRIKHHVKPGPISSLLAGLMDDLMVALVALALFFGCLLVASSSPIWVFKLLHPDHPSARSLPAYLNAEQTMRRSLTHEEAQQMGEQVVSGEVLTFQTRDAPEAVVSFYRSVLQKEGWVNSPNKENQFLLPIGRDGPTDYGPVEIAVSSVRESTSMTRGKVILAVSNGMCC